MHDLTHNFNDCSDVTLDTLLSVLSALSSACYVSLPITQFLTLSPVILDVRSPAEFAQGHIPGAVSMALFSDQERAQVGICYKQEGRDAAVERGFAIAGPKFAGFIAQANQLAPDRQVRLHCWRGGMRSEAVAWVLGMGGFQATTLIGGYKAFRNWALAMPQAPRQVLVLGGMTGTGKTDVLTALAAQGEQVLDLEAIASHRGSSFGGLGLPPQPTNEQFENAIALQWSQFDPQRPVWIEAESNRIGCCRLPEALYQQMQQAPVLELVRPQAERLALLVDVYGFASTSDLILATERIRKRLGGLRTQAAIALLQERRLAEAFELLLTYYDKAYDYDLQRRPVPIDPVDATGQPPTDVATQLIARSRQLQSGYDPVGQPVRLDAPLTNTAVDLPR